MAVPTEEIEKKIPTSTASVQVNAPDTLPEDPRFAEVKAEEDMLNQELNDTYDGMLENSNKFFDEQINATKDWEKTQKQLQQESTDFAVEKIQQQKDQAQKDYEKEQSAAYTDWQKQINPYGTDAERKAANGFSNTGYSESSQVAMYNAYQNRVAVAKESVNKAMLDYDNDIKEAMLQNNVAKAEIAFQSLQQRLELALQGFQNQNSLLLDKFNTKLQVKQYSDSRWQSVLDNIYREQTFDLQKEQFGLQEEQFEYNKAQDTKNNALNLILSGIGNEQLYEEAGLSFELGEALKNSYVSDREKLNLDLTDQKLALEREDAGTLLTLAQMGIKVPLTEGLKKMGITQSMLDDLFEKANAVSVSSGGYSGSYESSGYSGSYEPSDESDEKIINSTPITKSDDKDISPTRKTWENSQQPTLGGRYAVNGDTNTGDKEVALPSYAEIVADLKKAGVPDSKIKAFKTINQWSMHPNGLTYKDYVAKYLEDLGLV
ncbi:MAG: hypothetical protein IJZ54_08940 [Clostridia bacterium]|nr:hypothetical protein [Clostridia bacterium]